MANKIIYNCVIFVVWSLAMIASTDAQKISTFTVTCMGCICEAVSGCNRTASCTDAACGIFRISRDYWSDGGKLTLNNEDPTSKTAFTNCASDAHCSGNIVENYMDKFPQDCNGDNFVNCYDYAAIHLLGRNDCKGALPDQYLNTFNYCLQSVV